jgi:hypothetical protein
MQYRCITAYFHAKMLALPAKMFSRKVGLLKTASSIWQRFWQVRARLVSQISFQNQSMLVEPVKIQGVWHNPKTPNTALGRCKKERCSHDSTQGP